MSSTALRASHIVYSASVCVCRDCLLYVVGYFGVDCSLSDTDVPFIKDLRPPGSVCDVRGSSPCTAVSLFASNFSFTDNFTCKVVSTALLLSLARALFLRFIVGLSYHKSIAYTTNLQRVNVRKITDINNMDTTCNFWSSRGLAQPPCCLLERLCRCLPFITYSRVSCLDTAVNAGQKYQHRTTVGGVA